MAYHKEWERLFEMYPIEASIREHGFFNITSTQINKVKEARLMSKFDHYQDLPQILRKHNYAIMPTRRGSYVIAPMNLFHDFEDTDNSEITQIQWSHNLESIDINNIPSETVALNVADIAGIFEHFLGEKPTFSTLAGRMGSGSFEFSIEQPDSGKLFNIQVDKAQIEIDGSYETPNSYAIIEAKNQLYDDFLIRQLYYPYRTLQDRVKHKPIRPVFLMYYNKVFHLYEYEFQEPNNYNSIRLLKHTNYSLDDTNIKLGDLQNILSSTNEEPEPLEIPFPQADSFERIINLMEIVDNDNPLNNNEIAEVFSIEYRQGSYYSNAGRYLGLLDKTVRTSHLDAEGNEIRGRENVFITSRYGHQLLQEDYKNRQLALCRAMMKHRVFRMVVQRILDRLENNTIVIPSKNEIAGIMRECNINIGTGRDIMYTRRASTIKHWITWMFRLCNDMKIVRD